MADQPFIQVFGDIVEENGKTIRENNAELVHKHALGTLVEVKWGQYMGGCCGKAVMAHLYVVAHTRDCDSSPLYMLGSKPPDRWQEDFGCTVKEYRGLGVFTQQHLLVSAMANVESGFGEDSLTEVPVDKHSAGGKYVPTEEVFGDNE